MSAKIVGARLPLDMDQAVRQIAGDDLSNWIREAIAEKLERDSYKSDTTPSSALESATLNLD